jgi:hypothetical protein
MAANTSPVFPLTPVAVVGQTITTANTAKDGTGTVVTLHTAGANGSKVDGVYVAYTGTSVQTCLRLFINNGSTNATAGNNALLKSVTVPANTLSETAAAADFFVSLGVALPAGYKINATIGTAVAAALALTATGGDL